MILIFVWALVSCHELRLYLLFELSHSASHRLDRNVRRTQLHCVISKTWPFHAVFQPSPRQVVHKPSQRHVALQRLLHRVIYRSLTRHVNDRWLQCRITHSLRTGPKFLWTHSSSLFSFKPRSFSPFLDCVLISEEVTEKSSVILIGFTEVFLQTREQLVLSMIDTQCLNRTVQLRLKSQQLLVL